MGRGYDNKNLRALSIEGYPVIIRFKTHISW